MKLYIIGILAKILGIVIPPLLGVALLVSAECKVTASTQRRKGLNVVGLFGSLQPLADGLKLMIKELILLSSANLFISIMASVITFMSSSVAWAVILFDYGMVLSDSNVGILHLFAISSLGVYGIITVGRVSNLKYVSSGASRFAVQTVLYEVSIGPIIITVLICVGSRNFSEIVIAQKQIWFGIPLFPVLIMFFISCLAEINRAFFDPLEVEAESVAGYNVEYFLMGFAPLSLGEYANMILMSSLCTLLLLGGWPPISDFPIFEGISGSIWFSIKVPFFSFIHIRVCAAFSRYRYDQSMRLGWKVFLPLSLAWVVFVSGIPVAFDWLP
uniref:NADH-ubiquinone oxidoreductase chain 1 n=1 Tax=Phaeoceros laevis TaxID=37308 RepID=D3J0K3_9EMBR|nr:NADH dehydrogenase subunit 1 [Phaeoceros laevis]ACT75317.1 NADH dehydrogenase subunit 1 [Phaeoceros laevis]